MNEQRPNTPHYCAGCAHFERGDSGHAPQLPENSDCKHLERCGRLHQHLTNTAVYEARPSSPTRHYLEICGKMVVSVEYHHVKKQWHVEWNYNGAFGTLGYKDTEQEAMMLAQLFLRVDSPPVLPEFKEFSDEPPKLDEGEKQLYALLYMEYHYGKQKAAVSHLTSDFPILQSDLREELRRALSSAHDPDYGAADEVLSAFTKGKHRLFFVSRYDTFELLEKDGVVTGFKHTSNHYDVQKQVTWEIQRVPRWLLD